MSDTSKEERTDAAAGRRLKLTLILAVLVASALALLAWTQVWINAQVAIDGHGGAMQPLAVDGANAAPALTALALAGLALAGALSIAGVIIRFILGLLEILIGVSVFISAITAIADPSAASAAAYTALTGIAGKESTLVGTVDPVATFWPWIAVLAAAIMVIAGLGIAISARRWPGPTKRYQATRLEPVSDQGVDHSHDAVDDWDELSRGDDPTTGPTPEPGTDPTTGPR